MNSRATREDANAVSLFPFLAVLLCTMGALLVLLVVLAQRAGERVVAEQTTPAPPTVQQARYENSEQAVALQQKLDEVREYQRKLAELRKQADQRLREEQDRLSHLEEHTRRLEHELARLSLAAQQLEATEKERLVDQEQAERELARLQQLIKDTEEELAELREEANGKHSYAIVPYKGPNGTYRKPVYIECRKEGVTIHPEGIPLEPRDFIDPNWPGNPLAAALRATRTHINAKAAEAGAAEPPDPYPLILVRPDGVKQYNLVRAAISSWDATFGYEFIESDWKLNFPEAADPQLARVQQHAIYLARDQLERLVRSAPSRFRGRGFGGSSSGASGGRSGSNGFGNGSAEGGFSDATQLAASDQTGTGQGNGFSGGNTTSDAAAGDGSGSGNGETQYGALADADSTVGEAGAGQANAGAGIAGEGGAAQGSESGEATAAGNNLVGDRYAQSGGGQSDGGQSGGEGTAGTAGAEGSQGSNPGGTAGGGSPAGNVAGAGGGTRGVGSSSTGSIADSQGSNWAVRGGGRGSVPIRRQIQVVIRQNQLALLPSRHALAGSVAAGHVIDLNQPQRQISELLVAALRTRIEDWGLAGSGLYWRPVLKFNVGPGAEQTAQQVLHLLKNSGVEISLPETANATQRETLHAPR